MSEVKQIKIQGKVAWVEPSGRGYVTIRTNGFDPITLDLTQDEKQAGLQDDAKWAAAMTRLEAKAIKLARKLWV